MSDLPPPLIEPRSEAEILAPLPVPRRRRRPRWVLLGLLLLALAVVVLGIRTMAGVRATFDRLDRFVSESEAAFESVPLLSDAEKGQLRRSRNARHVELAQEFGVGPPATRAEADSLWSRYDLVEIRSDSLYTLLPGEYSLPVLTPSAAEALARIAGRFREKTADLGLPPFRFAVSSVWRSAADQAALRGGNVNAAAGHSSHEYATTFDLTYNATRWSPAPDALPLPLRVDPRVAALARPLVRRRLAAAEARALDQLAADYPSRLKALLGRALIELEDEDVVAVVYERRQPVFHVTLARRLVDRAETAP